ncbi:MAG: hypothetical protein IMZ50_10220 [Candidatus Atribacteria bacterium]|nr:hypothetical protein [Candidatus Atribacteria bacterium]
MEIIGKFASIANPEMKWEVLQPNEHGDWLSQRNDVFDTLIPIAPEKKFNLKNQSFFNTYSNGVVSSRDAWIYNFSKSELSSNMTRMINFYTSQRKKHKIGIEKKSPEVLDLIDNEPSMISWSVNLKRDLINNVEHKFFSKAISESLYRPFTKHRIYFDRVFIERPGFNDSFFPSEKNENVAIGITGLGSSKSFSPLITNLAFDFQTLMNGLIFPLYFYEEQDKQSPTLWDAVGESDYIRRDGVSDFILERAKKMYGKNVGKEDIFYYVYGILHSPEYRITFANDLKKTLPRLPLVEEVRDFWKFSKTGRQLAELHINYESVPPYAGVQVSGADSNFYKVEKMRFPKKGQQDTINYNSKIVVSNIPAKAYEYVINGKSAIEWIMERYAVTTHPESGIQNDPNDWANEVSNPRYILDLLLSVINVSVQTVDLVNGLPKLKFE